MALVSWTPPTEREPNEDGIKDSFTVEDIQRYDLFIGTESGVPYRLVGIEDRYLTSWQEQDLKGGDNYFTMTVTDNGDLESEHSNEIIKAVDSRCTGE